ncbi:diphthamide synthesis protein [Candidatus Woesearchaeota archaeon]|nr:diphthamide synthesis protein [Candidatus Woesearchaeota archaeon]
MTNIKYNLELSKVIDKITQTNSKNVCIQLPDGLKPYAKDIKERIASAFGDKVNVFIWAGSCFGACDTPHGLDKLGIDLLIQWGHSEWR